jgi:hypothetical protein
MVSLFLLLLSPDSVVSKGLEILNLKDVNVNVYYLEDINLKGDAANSDALLIGKDGMYDIYLKKGLTESELIEAVSHELIHLKQFETKRLIKKGAGIVIWEGSTLDYTEIDYSERGWEAEAFNQGRKLSKKIKGC